MFYSVRIGKIPGIYNTWSECKEQVNGFKGAKFKKFKSQEEALNFMENRNSKIAENATLDNYLKISKDVEYLPEELERS